MKYNEFISTLALASGMTETKTRRVLNNFREIVTECLVKGDEVHLTGLGVFYQGHRKARNVSNPQTKEIMVTSDLKVPRFRASKLVKEAVK